MSRRNLPVFTRFRIYDNNGGIVNCIDTGPDGKGYDRRTAMGLARMLRMKYGGRIYVRGAKS